MSSTNSALKYVNKTPESLSSKIKKQKNILNQSKIDTDTLKNQINDTIKRQKQIEIDTKQEWNIDWNNIETITISNFNYKNNKLEYNWNDDEMKLLIENYNNLSNNSVYKNEANIFFNYLFNQSNNISDYDKLIYFSDVLTMTLSFWWGLWWVDYIKAWDIDFDSTIDTNFKRTIKILEYLMQQWIMFNHDIKNENKTFINKIKQWDYDNKSIYDD